MNTAPQDGPEAPTPLRYDASSVSAGPFTCVAAAWAAHAAELRAFLRRQLRDGHVAEDLLQDVFIKAMRQGRTFCSLDNPRAWLFQVSRNAVIDRARLLKEHVTLDDGSFELEAPAAAGLEPVDALAECVDRVLGELPPEDMAVLRAVDLEGLTQREFAARSGLSVAAAKSRLLRARQRLRTVTLSKVEELRDVLSYCVIDGKVVHAGGMPGRDKIERWLAAPGAHGEASLTPGARNTGT